MSETSKLVVHVRRSTPSHNPKIAPNGVCVDNAVTMTFDTDLPNFNFQLACVLLNRVNATVIGSAGHGDLTVLSDRSTPTVCNEIIDISNRLKVEIKSAKPRNTHGQREFHADMQ